MQRHEFISDLCVRIDKFVSAKIPSLSRSYIQKLIDDGFILVDGKRVKRNFILGEKQSIIVLIPKQITVNAEPENIPLEIVYEDDFFIIINKQQGLVVHPAAGNPCGTLANALKYYCGEALSTVNGDFRPGIVHRIDKDTSGLLIAAKTDFVHTHIQRQIQEHKVMRKYIAIVHGNIKNDVGIIDKPIGRHSVLRNKMCIGGANPRNAVTHYRVLTAFQNYTFVECSLETGRTHQIRVHMASRGNPIVGDKIYGIKKEKFNLSGQMLHAKALGFTHPVTLQYVKFDSNLPQRFEKLLDSLTAKTAKGLDKDI